MFSKAKIQELMTKFAKVNVNDIQDASLRAKAAELKQKQGGFTLLELLVVVAILAAIAGTASIALKDTDARAAAAAHVAMMDELNKGIRTFRVLNRNALPDRWDSLISSSDGTAANATELVETLANGDVALEANTPAVTAILTAGGIKNFMVLNEGADADAESTGGCASDATAPGAAGSVSESILSRGNSLVAGNIFMDAHCGVALPLDSNADGDDDVVAVGDILPQLPMWTGGSARLTGTAQDADHDAVGNTAFMIVGVGPSSNLFDAETYGSMTTVPVYRHVAGADYNRFQAVFKVGTYAAAGAIVAADQVELMAIVDGAGDTKEEELGEWDGSRNTI